MVGTPMSLNLILSHQPLHPFSILWLPVSETAKYNAPESSTISYANFVRETFHRTAKVIKIAKLS